MCSSYSAGRRAVTSPGFVPRPDPLPPGRVHRGAWARLPAGVGGEAASAELRRGRHAGSEGLSRSMRHGRSMPDRCSWFRAGLRAQAAVS